jgi:hypothetical protein
MDALVDQRCKTALSKVGLYELAEQLARAAVETGAVEVESRFGFLRKEGEESSAAFVAELCVTVRRV